MDSWVQFIEPFALIITAVLTVVNLFATRSLTHSQQQSVIIATKRSERIDALREHSTEIITCCKFLLHNLDEVDTKKKLLHHGHSLISLLQYYNEYEQDVMLIKTTHKIIEIALADRLNKKELDDTVKQFWWMCNVYIGVDYERLKIESLGKINKGGASQQEASGFTSLYEKYNVDEADIFSKIESAAAGQDAEV